MKQFIQILTLAFLVAESICLKGLASKEYDLFSDLFKNYSKSVRPVNNWEDVIQVNIVVQVNKVAKVVENHQTMKLYVRMEMAWNDVNLAWNPAKYGGIKSLIVPAENLWIPEIHLFNSATEDDRIYPANVELWSNGTVITAPLNTLYGHCDYNFKRFPYDSQRCDFIIGTMLEKVNVKLMSFKAPVSKFLPNPEWSLLSITDGEEHEFLIPGTTNTKNEAFSYNWSASRFTIQIGRDSSFYKNLFVWPLVFVLAIATGIFILPPSCVERVSMGVLLLLTLVISSLMLESFTPKSAEPSVISNLIAFDMFMVTWSIVISTLIISIDKENFLMVKKIPQWARDAMLKYAGRLAFKQETLKRVLTSQRLVEDDEIPVFETNRLVEAVSVENNGRITEEDTAAAATETPEAVQNEALLTLISNQLGMFRKKLQENDVKAQNKQEWFLIASVLDRVCLIVYAIISLFGLFVILI